MGEDSGTGRSQGLSQRWRAVEHFNPVSLCRAHVRTRTDDTLKEQEPTAVRIPGNEYLIGLKIITN